MGLRRHNILSLLEDKTSDYAERVAVGMKTALGWEEFTYSGLGIMSRKIGHYLINTVGVKKGERCAILSESKPEYGACVFASVLSGMITVPLDVKLEYLGAVVQDNNLSKGILNQQPVSVANPNSSSVKTIKILAEKIALDNKIVEKKGMAGFFTQFISSGLLHKKGEAK